MPFCVLICFGFQGMQHSVISAALPYGVGLDEVFLPQYLKEQGYETHAIGKVDLIVVTLNFLVTSPNLTSLRSFLCFALRILTAHDFLRH